MLAARPGSSVVAIVAALALAPLSAHAQPRPDADDDTVAADDDTTADDDTADDAAPPAPLAALPAPAPLAAPADPAHGWKGALIASVAVMATSAVFATYATVEMGAEARRIELVGGGAGPSLVDASDCGTRVGDRLAPGAAAHFASACAWRRGLGVAMVAGSIGAIGALVSTIAIVRARGDERDAAPRPAPRVTIAPVVTPASVGVVGRF